MFIKKVHNNFDIKDIIQLELDFYEDIRGQIWTIHTENNILPNFVEDKLSISYYSVLRGLHGDSEIGKLITCLDGEIQIAIGDLRKNSPTYGKSMMFELSGKNPTSIYVPAGCVNGHLCLSDKCLFFYKWTKKYNGIEKQTTIDYKDSMFDFKWKLENVIISDRDKNKSTKSLGIYL
jgi:dTDP-4-dehydrorhamnose 3,5-epimerase